MHAKADIAMFTVASSSLSRTSFYSYLPSSFAKNKQGAKGKSDAVSKTTQYLKKLQAVGIKSA